MAEKKTDKDQLLDNASHLFRVKGYHNTSISDIAAACKLSKGSVYHYITSKQELGIAVIKRAHRQFQEKVFSISNQTHETTRQGVAAIFAATDEFFAGREGGSLMSNLAHEVTETVPEFVELFKLFYADWINALTKILKGKFSEEKARHLAEDTVSQLQGALLFSRLFDNKAILQRVGQKLIEQAEN